MPQPGTIIGAFTDEFGELGKNIVREAVAVPKDIAGKVLESLGTSTGQKKQQTQSPSTKPAQARAALAELAGYKPKPKEPSVWENIQMEAEQKKEMRKQQQAQAAAQALPVVGSKRPRGDLYGLKAKKFSGEAGKNVRQD